MILEYCAFFSALVCMWCYGYPGSVGPVTGVISALLFIAYGLVDKIGAPIITNMIFLAIHVRNWRKLS